jgi:hypothetical protein
MSRSFVKEIDGTVPWLRQLIDGFRLRRCPGFDHRVFHEWHRDGFCHAINILPWPHAYVYQTLII